MFFVSSQLVRLEDPDAEEVKEFVQKQVKLTGSVLEKCETREKLREKITKLFDHPRYDAPFRRADKYFYFHNTGLQAQNVFYVQVRVLQLDLVELYTPCLVTNIHRLSLFVIQDSLDGEPEVLLDPNALSEDGTVSLNTLSVSEDAKYLAYGLSASGSDWVTIKVMRVEDKKVEADTLSWVSVFVLVLFIDKRKRKKMERDFFDKKRRQTNERGFIYIYHCRLNFRLSVGPMTAKGFSTADILLPST